jgi:HEAT repeat protein
MKVFKIFLLSFSFLLMSSVTFSQDKRTDETKIADLLARFPAHDNASTEKMMSEMLLLGEQGIRKICDQILPAGTGDDTRPRFAVESLSRFLSGKGKEKERISWEKICIDYVSNMKDNGVKDFFMKQLQQIGGGASVEAVKDYLANKELCEPALAVILAAGGNRSEAVLAESLKNRDLPCAASVMNALGFMESQIAVDEYITWTGNDNTDIKASAFYALSQSGSPQAYVILSNAAAEHLYHWEQTGATASLLNYADILGQKGDIKTMDKICRLVISKCNDEGTMQNKSAALGVYVRHHGIDAMPMILKAAANSNSKYRTAAMRFTLGIPGEEVVKKWTAYFSKAIPDAEPEIIAMLGVRKDELALPVVNSALSHPDFRVRKEAAQAIAAISGKESINALINYMISFEGAEDQDVVKNALMSVMGREDLRFLMPVLKEGKTPAKITATELLSWSRDNKYFNDVFALASSSEEPLRAAAVKALQNMSDLDNQKQLIDLVLKTENTSYIPDIQAAIAVDAGKTINSEKRSQLIIGSMKEADAAGKIKLIPVLSRTGGREALAAVLNEFENGNADIRDVSFKTLAAWRDYSASTALFEILTSGNKTFESQAFAGYIKQIRSANLPDEQKYLLFRKIMPYARTAERKNEILAEMGKAKTYQCLFFVADYLDDPSTSAAAAKAAMSVALPEADSKEGMYGKIVRNILEKAVTKLAGQESEYEKEMVNKYIAAMPADEGFVPMFNGRDLSGWQGLVENPLTRAKMKPAELAKKQAEADNKVPDNWSVKDGCIWFNGKGNNLCSIKEYADFEMLVDWKITKEGDSGIYLRGTPQVQIWDTSRVESGAQVGSGGLYNNKINESKPLKVADNPIDEWNTFRIVMIGEKVSVRLNGQLVVDNVTMENYWDRNIPIFPKGAIELQAHGTNLAFRDIYVRELNDKDFNLTSQEKSDGFVSIFNGRNLDNWIGNKESYVVEDAMIVVKPGSGSGGNLYSEKEYSDFVLRFEFQLTPAANNGLGIRAPLKGDAAYVGMELQILDDTAPVYANLQPYQYHGSVYGVIPAKKGFQKPVGEWNYEEVTVQGTKIKVELNGTVIVDGDIAGPIENGTMDHNDHPGLKNKTGHIGFLGHGSELKFRNLRIKEIKAL